MSDSDYSLGSSTTEQTPVPAQVSNDDDPMAYAGGLGIRSTSTATTNIHRPWMDKHKFVLVSTLDELNGIVDSAIAAGKCALDLETEGLDNRIFYDAAGKPYTKHKIVGFCLSYDGVAGYYVPVGHKFDDGPCAANLPRAQAEEAITRLCKASQPLPKTPDVLLKNPLAFRELAGPPKVVIFFWNAKFDQEFLYPVTGIDWWHPESFEDGNLAYYCHYTDDKQLSLKWKAFNELKDKDGNPYEMIEIKDLFEKGRAIDFARLAPDEQGVIKYACSDAICTFLLCDKPRAWEKRLDVLGLCRGKYSRTYRIEKQCAQGVRWMERPRVRLNREKIIKLREENVVKRDEVLKKIVDLAHTRGFIQFDPKSTKALGEFLFGREGLNITVPESKDWPNGKPPLNEKSNQFKTDADTLERLVSEHSDVPEVLTWIVGWRGLEKMDSTYLSNMANNLDENSEMRFQFKQTGAATGRFSAPAGDPDQGYSGIPIHGIPATSALRTCFEARPGYTAVKADYAGEELRIAANVSGEMVWIKEFLYGDGDLHSITARAFFGKQDISKDERKMGKIANFALLYGGGPASIMRATGCDKLEATRRKQAFDKAVPTFASWIKGQHAKVKKDKGVWTALGRWIAIPDIDNVDKAIVAACERKSTNFPIQGTGADIMKIAIIILCSEFYKKGWLRQNGDDSVRLLLSVHDEVVFEIRHDRVQEAIVIINKAMAAPAAMAAEPHSPKWQVPLVVEPLIGDTWAGEYDYGMLTHGKPYKQGDKVKAIEIVVGDKVYHRVPPWLVGLFKPGYETGEEPSSHVAAPDTPTPPVAEATVVPSPLVQAPAAPKPVMTMSPSPVLSTQTLPVTKISIQLLLKKTTKDVHMAAVESLCGQDSRSYKFLHLIDVQTGQTLVEPGLCVKVYPPEFRRILTEKNITNAEYQ